MFHIGDKVRIKQEPAIGTLDDPVRGEYEVGEVTEVLMVIYENDKIWYELNVSGRTKTWNWLNPQRFSTNTTSETKSTRTHQVTSEALTTFELLRESKYPTFLKTWTETS